MDQKCEIHEGTRDCPKCQSLRKQRDGYICELVNLRKKHEHDIAELRKRIDVVSQDKHTRDDDLHYIAFDIEACLDVLGWRPDGEPPTYGGSDRAMFGDVEYVRDMLQANYRFYMGDNQPSWKRREPEKKEC